MNNLLYPKLSDFLKMANAIDSTSFPQRDTTKFFTYLKRSLSINLKMWGHYVTRKSALSSFGYTISSTKDEFLTKADEAKRRLNSAISTLLEHQLKTVAYGSLLVKLKVEPKDEGNVFTVEKVFEPTEYDYSGNGIIYLYNQGDRVKGYQTINLSDSNDYIFDTVEYPHHGGLLRSIIPMEILRWDMLLENANFLRKLKGLLQIVNKGGTPEDQAAAENAASNIIRDNFFVSSEAIELKLNQITASTGSAAFKDFWELCDSSISIAWLGQANTAELPKYSGSRAALQVQKMISADRFYTDMVRTERLIDQLLLLDYRLNYNNNAKPEDLPYHFLFNLAEEQDFEANTSGLLNIIDKIPLIESEVYARIGHTPPKQGDKLFKGFSD